MFCARTKPSFVDKRLPSGFKVWMFFWEMLIACAFFLSFPGITCILIHLHISVLSSGGGIACLITFILFLQPTLQTPLRYFLSMCHGLQYLPEARIIANLLRTWWILTTIVTRRSYQPVKCDLWQI